MKEKDTVPIFEKEVTTTTIETYEIPKWLAKLIEGGVSILKYLPRRYF